MTEEELDRIKKAYSSGLKVQIWFNGYWKDFDIRDYSMYSEPFSKNRQYRIVGSEYADIAEKRIADLEKKDKELREENKKIFNDWLEACDKYGKVSLKQQKNEEQLIKAKEIIRQFLNDYPVITKELLDKLEQFIKEIEK